MLNVDDFSQGYCHVFALAMNALFGFQIKVVVDAEADNALVHAYAVRSDGTFVDASGTITEADAIYDHGDCWEPVILEFTPDELKAFSIPSKWGSFTPAEMEDAVNLILASPEEYA